MINNRKIKNQGWRISSEKFKLKPKNNMKSSIKSKSKWGNFTKPILWNCKKLRILKVSWIKKKSLSKIKYICFNQDNAWCHSKTITRTQVNWRLKGNHLERRKLKAQSPGERAKRAEAWTVKKKANIWIEIEIIAIKSDEAQINNKANQFKSTASSNKRIESGKVK